MSVKDRLKRLTGEGQPAVSGTARQELISELRRRVDAIMARRAAYPQRTVTPASGRPTTARALDEVITGEEVNTGCGACFFTRSMFRAESYHGNIQVARLAGSDMKAAALLAGRPEIARMDLADAVFLDTETTGLAGGTGTFAFLVGLGWFEGRDFVVCQLFARDFHEEPSMLSLLQDMTAGKRFLVTFNGRAFDVSLLSARYILNRLEDPLAGMPHLDLLFPSRKLAGHRLENCRLVTLENEILGFTRTGDVPGWEIPSRYFDWLRSRDGTLLEDVFLHNRLDIVSMAALVSHFTDIVTRGNELPHCHPGDLLAAARLHLQHGDNRIARAFLEALMGSPDPLVVRDAGRTLSLFFKRQGRWEDAVRIWQDMMVRDPGDLFAAEEMAKWLEHRAYDHLRAIEIVETALSGSGTLSLADRSSLAHRLARLKRKAASAGRRPPE
ncbi:MAG TPA: ribonuclease H-like domain-containing protein [Deltaproteobacteria bacterium]|nr:ribonuclease H-like domain-containing protein [Deltaproteobacteria bacterium]